MLKRERWDDAEQAFRKGLGVPGYANDTSALDGIRLAQHGAAAEKKRPYDAAIATALAAMAKNDLVSAGCEMARVLELDGDGVEARALAAELGAQTWTAPEGGMEFVWIQALRCWVGKYEVTNGEYRKYKADHDSKEYGGHSLDDDRQPVVYVSFDDATAYAAWLTQRERAAGRLPDGLRYRLPTRDEWMTFAQCGDGREYPWGNQWPPKDGNYSDSASASSDKIDGYTDGNAVTCAVEQSGRNDWGLYGVGGDVWECTSASAGGGFDAWRGASWNLSVRSSLSCSFRFGIGASYRGISNGFRLVLSF